MQANGCRKSVQGRALCGDGGFATLCAVRVRLSRIFRASVLISATLLFSPQLALAQFTQQGQKLVGTGAVGSADQGFSVALSADGNTAIVGGYGDNSNAGAAWVYTRSGGVWTQQGIEAGRHRRGRNHRPTKATPSRCPPTATPPSWAGLRQLKRRGGVGLHPQRRCLDPAGQQAGRHRRGWNAPTKATPSRCPPTATPPSWAGPTTTPYAGAAWVFTRSGGVWTQQGSEAGRHRRGWSRTPSKATPSRCPPTATPPSWAGLTTTRFAGAAWVFTRSGGVWTQQGSEAGRHRRGWTRPHKATPSRCPPTATPPSSAGPSTTPTPGRRGSLSSRRPRCPSSPSSPISSSTSRPSQQKMASPSS